MRAPALTPEQRQARGRIAALVRHAPDAAADAVRDFRAERAADYIKALVGQAPPLTKHQRAWLATLLEPADAGDEAA